QSLDDRAPRYSPAATRPSGESFFFFNDTATTEIYTLSLHDALPISVFHHSHPVKKSTMCAYPASMVMVSSPRPFTQPPPVSGQIFVPRLAVSPAVPYAPAMAISHAVRRNTSAESPGGAGAHLG